MIKFIFPPSLLNSVELRRLAYSSRVFERTFRVSTRTSRRHLRHVGRALLTTYTSAGGKSRTLDGG